MKRKPLMKSVRAWLAVDRSYPESTAARISTYSYSAVRWAFRSGWLVGYAAGLRAKKKGGGK